MSFLKKIFKSQDEPINSNEDFWNWFQKNEKKFFNAVKNNKDVTTVFFDQLSPKLGELKEGYFFLTGMKNDTTAELIITPDGIIKNFVFVEDLINDAPKIDGWLFTALKSSANGSEFEISMNDYKFNTKKIFFYANNYKNYPDEIDITIIHEDLNEENKKEVVNGTYIFLDNYIGELKLATIIDNVQFLTKKEVKEELVPIHKLNDFLIWRQKEFLEKYEGERHQTENDNYGLLKAQLENGNELIAVLNMDLLKWDGKASHPWILEVKIDFEGINNSGMPDNETSEILNEIEDDILKELKDFEGHLNIGRETLDNNRYIYFACKDFRKPSKVVYKITDKYKEDLRISYEIYKDKYWHSFDRFQND